LNVSIGQGDIVVTPIQVTRMLATVAREGREVSPHVIKAINGKAVDDFAAIRQVKGFDPSTFFIVKKGLRSVVTAESGTAHILDLPGLYVAGKTGTAQTSTGKEDHAWFSGYVRSKTSDLAFCVFLEHGGSSQNAVIMAQKLLLALQKEGIL